MYIFQKKIVFFIITEDFQAKLNKDAFQGHYPVNALATENKPCSQKSSHNLKYVYDL